MGMGNPGSGEPVLLGADRLVRRRRGGPLQPDPAEEQTRPRPSLKRALEIANSPELVHRARLGYQQLSYAAGTIDTKNSLFRAWCEILGQHDLAPVPLTIEKCQLFCSIMRAAGFRSTYSYLMEARQRHIKAGFCITPQLDLCLKECRRVCTRAIGPPRRSEEVRLEHWQLLLEADGRFMTAERATAPHGGLLVWALGTHYLLREIEMASLVFHREIVRLDNVGRKASLCLTVSKSDPSGRGAMRTLQCCGKAEGAFHGLGCPFEVVEELVCRQEFRTGVDRCAARAFEIPLIGQEGNPMAFVEKAEMIAAAQRDAGRLVEKVQEAEEVDPSRITGHFMRRSGAKLLARSGVPLELIKHAARHSSSAIEGYVEQALEECPNAATLLADHRQMQRALIGFRKEVEELKGEIDRQKDTLDNMASVPQGGNVEALEQEVRDLWANLRPKFIRNLVSGVVHSTLGCPYWMPPGDWSTACGWKWAASSRNIKYVQENELGKYSLCTKCFP